MAHHHNEDHKQTLADKVAGFITKNKIILWGILGVLAISTVVFAVVDKKIKDTKKMNSNMAIEIQNDFQDWYSSADEDKEASEMKLLDNITAVIETGKTSILMEKALYTRGQFHLHTEEWEKAYDDFSKIVEISPDSYLASISLYNSASAKENSGDNAAALEILVKLLADYKSSSPIIPETLFNIGRINESLNNNEAAIESYEELASSYSSSNWTNLAKTRIISLKASGVSQ